MKKIIKMVLYLLLIFTSIYSISYGETDVRKSDLIISNGKSASTNNVSNVQFKDNFLKGIKNYLTLIYSFLAIGVFLYIGYSLISAKGQEEEFKKAWKALVYAIIGIAIIPLAYVFVKVVTGISIN